MTNTQSSCSGEKQTGRIPNAFKGTIGLPQAAPWRATSDKDIASLKKRSVVELIPITSVPKEDKVIATRLQGIHMILVFAAKPGYEVHLQDVQTAFLNTDVEEDVFVTMALGYETNGRSEVPQIMKLKKSLYRSPAESEELSLHHGREALRRRPPPAQASFVRVHLRGQDWLRHLDTLHGRHCVPQRQQDST